jgi:hypothetical protein
MFKKFISFFTPKNDGFEDEAKRRLSLLQEVQEENKKLKTEIFISKSKKELPHPLVGVDVEDPAPVQMEQRKLYVGQVAGFHKDIQKKKIISMISDARSQFEKINRETFGYSQKEYDLFLKGTINGLWLIHDWGEAMINEHLSYQSEEEELSNEDKEKLKAKLN